MTNNKGTKDEEDDSDIYDITRRKTTREKWKTKTSKETNKEMYGRARNNNVDTIEYLDRGQTKWAPNLNSTVATIYVFSRR
jgi:hypothetical protein